MKEEPHHHDKSPPASEEGSPGPTDQLAGDEEEQTKESNFKAVSGFFSGFAAAVQSTVSIWS